MLWNAQSNAADWFDGQEILIECPIWRWEASPIFGAEYELCFDDINHCTVAEIGDSVCIPSLGIHDIWITAIEHLSGEPIHYDGDIVRVERVNNADFSGDGVVGIEDLGLFAQFFGGESGGPGDLNEDGVVGILDFSQFKRAYGKCLNESKTLYEPC
jgi:hypothetical protein